MEKNRSLSPEFLWSPVSAPPLSLSHAMELCRHLRSQSTRKEVWTPSLVPSLPLWPWDALNCSFFICSASRPTRWLLKALLAMLLGPRKHHMLFHTELHQIPHPQNQVACVEELPINSFVGPGCGCATQQGKQAKTIPTSKDHQRALQTCVLSGWPWWKSAISCFNP